MSDSTREFLTAIWQAWKLPSVIDADALTLLSQGLELPQAINVLTPHPGEMARLLGISAGEVQSDRFESVKRAATSWNAIVLLKGRHTLTADTKSVIAVNPTGNAGMATGGMGDVLSGAMAAFLAQHVNPFLAAVAAVYVHGAAGDHCADAIGEVGFAASEVADAIPFVRAKLAAWPD